MAEPHLACRGSSPQTSCRAARNLQRSAAGALGILPIFRTFGRGNCRGRHPRQLGGLAWLSKTSLPGRGMVAGRAPPDSATLFPFYT